MFSAKLAASEIADQAGCFVNYIRGTLISPTVDSSRSEVSQPSFSQEWGVKSSAIDSSMSYLADVGTDLAIASRVQNWTSNTIPLKGRQYVSLLKKNYYHRR